MGEWIEHTGDCYPVPRGTAVTFRRADGSEGHIVLLHRYELGRLLKMDDGTYNYSAWHSAFWPEDYVNLFWDQRIIAYRLSDTDDKAKREARIELFRGIAKSKEFLIEETLKPREKVK